MKKSVPILLTVFFLAGLVQAQSISVTSPAAEDYWTVGSAHDVVWTIRGAMDDAHEDVVPEVSRGNNKAVVEFELD